MKRIFVIVVLVGLLLSGCAKKVVYPPKVQTTQIQSGTLGGPVNTLGIYNNDLIVGGEANSSLNGLQNIAKWDGSIWTSIGNVGFNGNINTQAVYNGNLVVAGQFDRLTNVKANNIAQWNGSMWTTLGRGFNGGVYSMAVFNGNLYVSGVFDTAGTVAAKNIAQWNGTSWSAVDSGIGGYLGTLMVYNGKLIGAGSFFSLKHSKLMYVGQYDGTSWSTLGPMVSGTDMAYSLTIYKGNLIAGCQGLSGGMVEECYGSSWFQIGNDLGAGIKSLAEYNGELVAGYYYENFNTMTSYVGIWNGTSWFTSTQFSNNLLVPWTNAFAVYNGSLIMGGYIPAKNGVESYNGSTWNSF